MSKIVEKIKNISDLNSIKGCTTSQIKEAQKKLGIEFPEEYVDYVKAFGCIDFGSTEWTGLNIKGRLNTVDATQKEKEVNPNFPSDCFVLEDIGMDGQKVIVDEEGKVYLLQYDKVTPLFNSMSEYLDSLTN